MLTSEISGTQCNQSATTLMELHKQVWCCVWVILYIRAPIQNVGIKITRGFWIGYPTQNDHSNNIKIQHSIHLAVFILLAHWHSCISGVFSSFLFISACFYSNRHWETTVVCVCAHKKLKSFDMVNTVNAGKWKIGGVLYMLLNCQSPAVSKLPNTNKYDFVFGWHCTHVLVQNYE